MPLTFSENDGMQNQQAGFFKELNDIKRSDACMESYNSCSMSKVPYPLETKYKNLNNGNCKSEDLSLDIDCEFDKTLKHIHVSEDVEEDAVVETTALRYKPKSLDSTLDNSDMTNNYLTVSGTIKRGKKKGQSVEVILNISREELEVWEANMTNKTACLCSTKNGVGLHVLIWTILCFPFSIIISGAYSFCMGTITWYNIFKLFSENKSMGYKISVPPVLIILYPFLIITISLMLGLYAGVKQLSCSWDLWMKEFTDYEKGFYGWICNSLDIPECSPYEVVVLSTIPKSLK